MEHELLQLWSSVEKDRDAAEARRLAHAERRRRRAAAAQTKLAPISSSPVGLGGAAAGAGAGDGKGSWQRLRPPEDEGEEGLVAAAGGEAAAAAAGAAAAQARLQAAALAAEAAEAGEAAAAEQRSLLHSGGGATGGSEQGAPASPLRVPPHLPRIRTSSAASLQQLEQQRQQAQQEVELQSAAAVAVAARAGGRPAPPDVEAAGASEGEEDADEGTYLAGEWGTGSRTASRQLERLPSGLQRQGSLAGQQLAQAAQEGGGQGGAAQPAGGGLEGPPGAVGPAREPSFWCTLREMLLDIRLVASGPERHALQVGVGWRWQAAARRVPRQRAAWRSCLHSGGPCAGAAAGLVLVPLPLRCRGRGDATNPTRVRAWFFWLQMALWLAFFNQAFASTSIINYAPEVRPALPQGLFQLACLVNLIASGLSQGGSPGQAVVGPTPSGRAGSGGGSSWHGQQAAGLPGARCACGSPR